MSQPPIETGPRMFDLKELCTLLVRESGVSEGVWDLSFEFQVGFGAAGPAGSTPLPSAIVGVKRIGLTPAKGPGPYTVDAAEITSQP